MDELNLIHRARLPQAGAGQLAPAVVMIHGWMGDEHAMWAFDSVLPPEALAVSPRGPLQVGGGGYGWFGEPEDPRLFSDGLAALRQFVARLPRVYPIDPARVVLMGFSQGAAASVALALSDPEMVGGVAALAGFLPAAARQWVVPGRLAGRPVFIAHGTEDVTLPLEEAIRARDALALAGAEVTYCEYPGGHKLNMDGIRDLTRWLASAVG